MVIRDEKQRFSRSPAKRAFLEEKADEIRDYYFKCGRQQTMRHFGLTKRDVSLIRRLKDEPELSAEALRTRGWANKITLGRICDFCEAVVVFGYKGKHISNEHPEIKFKTIFKQGPVTKGRKLLCTLCNGLKLSSFTGLAEHYRKCHPEVLKVEKSQIDAREQNSIAVVPEGGKISEQPTNNFKENLISFVKTYELNEKTIAELKAEIKNVKAERDRWKMSAEVLTRWKAETQRYMSRSD